MQIEISEEGYDNLKTAKNILSLFSHMDNSVDMKQEVADLSYRGFCMLDDLLEEIKAAAKKGA